MEDQEKPMADASTAAAPKKGTSSERAKNTLFIRNLPFTATNQEFEAFFGEFGPLKSCFVVMEASSKAKETTEEAGEEPAEDEKPAAPQKSKGFGAVEEDAVKALEALKTAKFQGRKLKGELAMKKHVKFDHSILSQELPKMRKAVTPSSAPAPGKPSNRLLIKFVPSEGKPDMGEFNKKQLYKKVRKVGNLTELVYPHEDDRMKALAVFGGVQDAVVAKRKLDNHIFKGIRMQVAQLTREAGEPASATVGVKAHRLIVRNLPFSITAAELDGHFGSFGRVLEIVLPTKPGSRVLRGFAFVQFEEKEAAVLAMAATNGKELGGRPVAVDWAVGKTLYEQIVKSEQHAVEPQVEDEDVDVEQVSAAEEEEDEEEEEGNEDEQEEEANEESDVDVEEVSSADESDEHDRTVFVRNIAYESNETALSHLFASRFGPLEYCKLVVNPQTGLSKGTAFVRFVSAAAAQAAIKAAAELGQDDIKAGGGEGDDAISKEDLDALKRKRAGKVFKSVLTEELGEGEEEGARGVLFEGRALSVVPAVDRDRAKALKLAETSAAADGKDKRRLALISESLIKPASPQATKFWSDRDIKDRQASVKARLADLRRNPNSIISNVRLSVRHLPVALDETQLRQVFEHGLAEAISHIGSLLDDQPVLKENAAKAKPRLKQVKIVRSTGEERENRAGRSKGFGFIELTQPSHALLALRYMTNVIPDIWHKQLPALFGRRQKTGKEPAAKPQVPVIEFAIDKIAVLEKTGKAAVKKQQVHKRPAPAKPAGGFKAKKPKRSH